MQNCTYVMLLQDYAGAKGQQQSKFDSMGSTAETGQGCWQYHQAVSTLAVQLLIMTICFALVWNPTLLKD
jgi:hypothetical protein